MNKSSKYGLIAVLVVFLMIIAAISLGTAIFRGTSGTSASPAEQELKRLEKLAGERITEAKRLRIGEKAAKLVEEFGEESWPSFPKERKIFSSPARDVSITREKDIFNHHETVEIAYNGQAVFSSYSSSSLSKTEIRVYKPGEWLKTLDALFGDIGNKKAKTEIENLKRRYGF